MKLEKPAVVAELRVGVRVGVVDVVVQVNDGDAKTPLLATCRSWCTLLILVYTAARTHSRHTLVAPS